MSLNNVWRLTNKLAAKKSLPPRVKMHGCAEKGILPLNFQIYRGEEGTIFFVKVSILADFKESLDLEDICHHVNAHSSGDRRLEGWWQRCIWFHGGASASAQESPVVRTVHIQMCAWQACLCTRPLFWSPIALEGGRAG